MCDHYSDESAQAQQIAGDDYATKNQDQPTPTNSFNSSLLDRLLYAFNGEHQRLHSEIEALRTRAKVIDILTVHPEFEDFIFVLRNLEA